MPPDDPENLEIEEQEELAEGDEGADDALEGDDDGEETGSEDDGEGDGHAGAEGAEEGDEAEGQRTDRQAKPLSRSQRRVQAALRRAEEAEERSRRLEREFNDFRSGQTGRSRAEEEAAERARLEVMTPEERFDYLRRKDKDEILAEVRRSQFVTADQNDKAAFAARAATDPLYRRYEERVEKELRAMRANGQNVPREALLSYLIGQDALKRRGEVAGKQRRKAAEVRRRETAKPGNARGDAPGQRGKTGKTARERLEGVTF